VRGIGPPGKGAAQRPDGAGARPRTFTNSNSPSIASHTGLNNRSAVSRNRSRSAEIGELRAENLAALRRRSQVEAIRRLGPRALAELLDELRRHHPAIAEDIDQRLARYAALDPQILASVGGDRWPAVPIHAIGGAGR
jgi:hypothetical protein